MRSSDPNRLMKAEDYRGCLERANNRAARR